MNVHNVTAYLEAIERAVGFSELVDFVGWWRSQHYEFRIAVLDVLHDQGYEHRGLWDVYSILKKAGESHGHV